MSHNIGFRCPDDLFEIIQKETEKTRKERTAIIVEAIRKGFNIPLDDETLQLKTRLFDVEQEVTKLKTGFIDTKKEVAHQKAQLINIMQKLNIFDEKLAAQ